MILLTRPEVSALRKIKFLISVVDPGEGPSLVLDQTEARRAEKKLETAPPPSSPVGPLGSPLIIEGSSVGGSHVYKTFSFPGLTTLQFYNLRGSVAGANE